METTITSPIQALLRQASDLAAQTAPIIIDIDYEAITRAAVKVVREAQAKIACDPRVLLTQNEAHKAYGKSVITSLLRRGRLQQYKFDLREVHDKDGQLITKAKGVVYYRVVEIETAIEEGNVLKGTRRMRQ